MSLISDLAFLLKPGWRSNPIWRVVFLVTFLSSILNSASAPTEFILNFQQKQATTGWLATHDLLEVQGSASGLKLVSSGEDPYSVGPRLELPHGTPVWFEVEVKSEVAGSFQIFYFEPQSGPSEIHSVRMNVPANKWTQVQAPAPDLMGANRLRIDPPSGAGVTLVKSINIRARVTYEEPELRFVAPVKLLSSSPEVEVIRSGQAELRQSRDIWNSWNINRGNVALAESPGSYWIGYVMNSQPVWGEWSEQERRSRITWTREINSWTQTKIWTDPNGAVWRFSRQISASEKHPGWFDGRWTVQVDQERDVLFVPLEFGFLGSRSFGSNKVQALFSGLEYLANEPSSSEKDLIGPESERRIPDTLKITMPLQTIVAEGAYASFIWKPASNISAWFDSPDRRFGIEGHVMGAFFPGTGSQTREPGSMAPYKPTRLAANDPVELDFSWNADSGDAVTSALMAYNKRFPFPKIDHQSFNQLQYLENAAAGWLDSSIREGALYRHANWMGRFNPGPAADAYFYLNWIADQFEKYTTDPDLSGVLLEYFQKRNPDENLRSAKASTQKRIQELREQARAVASTIPEGKESFSNISHVRALSGSLYLGSIESNRQLAAAQAIGALNQITHEGIKPYQSANPESDYGKTHWTHHANGLTGALLNQALEASIFSGRNDLVQQTLTKLDQALLVYKRSEPRGAQTWEVPLHTPDILASAHWVAVCVSAYRVTGDTHYLDEARYWAWTGVPFVYQNLENTEVGPIGDYSTIPVYGATSWISPVWLGLPVQWCGLVYADSLYQLAEVDDSGIWKQLADGITLTGAQHTWPNQDQGQDRDRAGLLPDFFNLREQFRDGPAINPGTLQAPMMRYFGSPPFYQWKKVNGKNSESIFIIAPGSISRVKSETDGAHPQRFRIEPLLNQPYWMLINGDVSQPNWVAEKSDQGDQIQITPILKPTQGWIIKAQGAGILEIN